MRANNDDLLLVRATTHKVLWSQSALRLFWRALTWADFFKPSAPVWYRRACHVVLEITRVRNNEVVSREFATFIIARDPDTEGMKAYKDARLALENPAPLSAEESAVIDTKAASLSNCWCAKGSSGLRIPLIDLQVYNDTSPAWRALAPEESAGILRIEATEEIQVLRAC